MVRNPDHKELFLSIGSGLTRMVRSPEHLNEKPYFELVEETQREIDLQHPPTFKNFNLCLLLSNKRLSDALKKLKLCDLREMQEGLNVEINGPSSRKAKYIEPLVNLVNPCIREGTVLSIIGDLLIIYVMLLIHSLVYKFTYLTT